jgi:hypothetical protein
VFAASPRCDISQRKRPDECKHRTSASQRHIERAQASIEAASALVGLQERLEPE